MSYDTRRTWFYYLNGRDIHLYQKSDYGRIDTLSNYKIRLPEDPGSTYLIYPDEDITDGLRIEYTALEEPFVAEALEDSNVFADGTGFAFVDGGGGSDTITDSNSGFSNFAATDKIRVIGSASNDGDYQLTGAAAGTLTMATGLLTTEAAGESITIYQIPKEATSPDEDSHLNLNRMLSLACVDYLKAMLADRNGDIERKEYYMREFWKKVGDGQSNRRKISIAFPSSPHAIR